MLYTNLRAMMYKSSVRNLWKNKSHTLINILGLTLGISCSIVLFLLIRFWLSFDTYHSKADRIYRMVSQTTYQGNTDYTAGVPVPMADALRLDFPELEEILFISFFRYGLVTIHPGEEEAESFAEENGLAYADENFFKVLDRKLLQGNVEKVLDGPNQAVLSVSLAEKYFGKNWPSKSIIGKNISLNKDTELKISGVMEDYPIHTDFPFSMLVSFTTVKKQMLEEGWGSIDSDDQIYILLPEGQSAQAVNDRLGAFMEKHDSESVEEMQKVLSLQPLKDIHFDERRSAYSFSTVPMPIIYSLAAVALFMVLIACINFINLATAIATKRAREVGIRKVLGSSKAQLMRIFMSEAVLITLLSIIIALGVAELTLVKMNDFLGLSLEINLFEDASLIVFLLLVLVVVSFFSGTYPSWVLARFEPSRVLKTSLSVGRRKGFNMRRGLVIFQFIIAQAFIIGTLVLISQTRYMRQADLGFTQRGIVKIYLPEEDNEKKKSLKNEFLRIAGVDKVSLAYSSPTSGSVSVTSVHLEGDPTMYHTQVKYTDQHYTDVYGIDLLSGEGLSEVDTMSRVVVNEQFLKKVGIPTPEDAIGKTVKIWGQDLPIVGVMKDFHTVSLRGSIEPTILIDQANYRFAHLSLNTQNLSRTMTALQQEWELLYPEYTFDYKFVEDEIAQFYDSERQMAMVLTIASIIVIFIGCLGLYGLITFMAEQKTKEVGVRKVLGASVASIVGLFSMEFIKLILLAFLLAAPLAYYIMGLWLQNFEYKIELGVELFFSGVILTLVIALATITYRSLKAAHTNPAQSLRND